MTSCGTFGCAALRMMQLADLGACAYYAELLSSTDPRQLAGREEAQQFARDNCLAYLNLDCLGRCTPSRVAV